MGRGLFFPCPFAAWQSLPPAGNGAAFQDMPSIFRSRSTRLCWNRKIHAKVRSTPTVSHSRKKNGWSGS